MVSLFHSNPFTAFLKLTEVRAAGESFLPKRPDARSFNMAAEADFLRGKVRGD